MTYELKLDLLGGADVEAILKKLSGLSGALGQSGSIFGGGASSPTQKLATDLDKAKGSATGLKKEISSIATAAAQGLNETGKVWLNMFSKKGGAQGAFGLSAEALKRNTHLASMFGGGESEGGDEREAKAKLLKRFQILDAWGNARFQAIRDKFSAEKFWNKAVMRGLKGIMSPDEAKAQEEADRAQKEGNRAALAGSKLNLAMRKDSAKAAEKSEKDLEAFAKNFALVVGPIFNPGGALTTAFAARQVFSSFTTQKGQGIIGKFGLTGTSGAMTAAAVVTAATTAIGFALEGLTKVVEATAKAFEAARQLYAKALTGGMGLQWTAKRSLVAQIMGVSETEVFRFGAQLQYLNPRLEQASQILAQTATPLTKVAYDWKVLMADISASFAKLGTVIAPALDGFINRLDSFVKIINGFNPKPMDWLKMAMFPGLSALKMLFHPLDSQKGSLPGPASWMKQLPASSWEKMGLVVGGMGTNNYAKQTAHNTRQMATDLRTMAKFMAGGGRFGGGGAGGQWGMSPQQNAP